VRSSIQSFDVDMSGRGKRVGIHYAVMCLSEDLSVKCLFALWDSFLGHLYIYDELVVDMPRASVIASSIVSIMRAKTLVVDKIIGNSVMFEDKARTFAKELNNKLADEVGSYQGMKVREAKHYDPYGSVAILNEMVANRKITIHEKCKTAWTELISWRLDSGKMVETGMRQAMMMIVSELLKSVPEDEVLLIKQYKRVITEKKEEAPLRF
jgi:hypothetical protein